MKYRQKGYNCLWPWEIETWKMGEKVPEWLSDIALVEFIDGEGNITLRTRSINNGGYEILQAGIDKAITLVRVNKKEDFVFIPSRSTLPKQLSRFELSDFSSLPLSISPSQLKLLYDVVDK